MPPELVPSRISVSHDTIEALEALLAGAHRGEITGVAFVATLKGQRYVTDAAGYCYKHPTFARGAALALVDELGHLVHGRDPTETR